MYKDNQVKERPLSPADNRDFKIVWNASTPFETPTIIEGQCVICESLLSNHQNHYTNERETVKICLSCVRELSTSFESIFNSDRPKSEL